MTFAERIALAMKHRGPMATEDIYRVYKRRFGRPSPHWRATVRNTLQRGCRRNPKFMGKALFIHRSKGVWECR